MARRHEPLGVLDFHARLAPRAGALEALLRAMDATGIAKAAVSAGGVASLDVLAAHVMEGGYVEETPRNDVVLEATRTTSDRLIPFFFANPHAAPDDYEKSASDFRGVELSPSVHGVGLLDPRTRRIVEIAAGAGHCVYVVCIGREGSRASDLAVLAAAHPEVTFVLGHCGFVGIDVWSLDRIAALDNVMAETSGCYTRVALEAVKRLGPDRLLFGTEYPLQHPSVELAKMRALALDDETWRSVTWRNAARLLGEEPA